MIPAKNRTMQPVSSPAALCGFCVYCKKSKKEQKSQLGGRLSCIEGWESIINKRE